MTEQYKDERQPPTVPHCGIADFSLEFNGHYLYLRNYKVGADFVSFAYPAVSGKSIDGKFIYTAERQKLKNIGPIPEGIYWIKPSEIQNNVWYRFNYNSAAWGKHWLTIHPLESTNTHARGGFFIHGGTTPGSAGCIDLTTSIDSFTRDLQRLLNGKKECYITLAVRY